MSLPRIVLQALNYYHVVRVNYPAELVLTLQLITHQLSLTSKRFALIVLPILTLH